MADYWKSVPKRLCPICNVWMYDNRPSIERHERSSKHLERLEKKMERAMRPRRNDEKIEKVVDQVDPLAHVTNSAFKIDGVGVSSTAPTTSKKPKKLKINFAGHKFEQTPNIPGPIVQPKPIVQPEIIDAHPILGGWETVRIVERPTVVEETTTSETIESSTNEIKHEDIEEPTISEFQVRINANAMNNEIKTEGGGSVEFKKVSRKRPSAPRKPIGS